MNSKDNRIRMIKAKIKLKKMKLLLLMSINQLTKIGSKNIKKQKPKNQFIKMLNYLLLQINTNKGIN